MQKPPKYELEFYTSTEGKSPFDKWANSIKNQTVKAKLSARLYKASEGHFGDFKSIKGAKGIFEMREHYSPGYRIFYSVIGNKILLLLAGSTKQEQAKVIERAKKYLADYEMR